MNNLDPEVQRLQQFNQELKVIKAKIEEQIKRTRKRENEALLQRFKDEKVASVRLTGNGSCTYFMQSKCSDFRSALNAAMTLV